MNTQNADFRRGELLLAQGRHELAEQHLRLALASDPDDGLAHSYLAACLTQREAHTEATREAQQGVGLMPESGYAHYTLARVLVRRNMHHEARQSAEQSVALAPEEAQFWGLLAGIHIDEKRYAKGLEAADTGLESDPEDEMCVTMRARALAGMGRSKQAAGVMAGALERRPDSAVAHATLGWTKLQQEQPKPALEHFSEALRLDPGLDWARGGLVEAMKARYLVYRIMLGYFLFMARLPSRTQWAIILGGLLGNNILKWVAHGNPAIAPYVWPVTFVYLGFVVMTWISIPIANSLLCLNRFGRQSLRSDQRRWAYAFGAWLMMCLGLVGAWVCGAGLEWIVTAGLFATVLPPLAMCGLVPTGWGRWVMFAYTCGIAVMAAACVGLMLIDSKLVLLLIAPTIWGGALGPLAANLLSSLRPSVKR